MGSEIRRDGQEIRPDAKGVGRVPGGNRQHLDFSLEFKGFLMRWLVRGTTHLEVVLVLPHLRWLFKGVSPLQDYCHLISARKQLWCIFDRRTSCIAVHSSRFMQTDSINSSTYPLLAPALSLRTAFCFLLVATRSALLS